MYLYEEIKNKIRTKIADGYYKKGEQIPTEPELSKEYNASRITIRRAVKELELEGILQKIHGKGTFVREDGNINIKIFDMEGFKEYEDSAHIRLIRHIISKSVVEDERLDTIFGRKDEKYFKLERIVCNHKDKGIFKDVAYFPLSLYPDIADKIEENTSTFEIMKRDYDISFDNYQKIISVEHHSDINKELGLNPIAPLLVLKKSIFDDRIGVIHYSDLYLDSNEISLELKSF